MNYDNLARALTHYRERGFAYVDDAPWLVNAEAYNATKPVREDVTDVTCVIAGQPTKFFVASGEQSFIQLLLDGRMLKRAVCLTPCFRAEAGCFRAEAEFSEWHKLYFQKVELINAHDPSMASLIQMVHDAMLFFERQVAVRVVETGPEAFDIVTKKSRIELGSYGIRRVKTSKELRYIYGTGCAEPRLSSALDREAWRREDA